MSETITLEELQQAIRSGTVVVLEALPPLYYEQAHLPGALNLPLDELDARIGELVADKDQAIVVYCSNTACNNSAVAAARLRARGYRNVRKYPGGKQEWMEAGLPAEASTHV